MPLFRRKHKPRHDQRILVEQDVTITPSEADVPFDAVTGNLSASGMFVPTLAPLAQGSEFAFDLDLGHHSVHGRARVVWSREFEDGPDRPAGMGVTFVEIASSGARLLSRFVDAHVQAGATVQVGAMAPTPPPGALESALHSASPGPPKRSFAPAALPPPRRTFRRPLLLAALLVLAILGAGVVLAPRVGALLGDLLAAPAGEASLRVASQVQSPRLAGSDPLAEGPPSAADPADDAPAAARPNAPVASRHRPGEPATASAAEEKDPPPPAAASPRRAAPPPPTATQAAFTGVDDIRIRRQGPDLVVSLLTDGPLPRWDHLRLDAGNPREVIRLYGVSRPFPRNLLSVGEAELRQIRTGYHEDAAGDQLHVVLDLAAGDVKLVATEEEPLRLDLHLRRE